MSGRRLWVLATAFGLAGCSGPEHRANLFPASPSCNSCNQPNFPPDQHLSPYPSAPAIGPPAGTYMPPATGATQLPPYTPPPTVGDSGGPVGMSDPAVRPAIDASVRLDGPQKYIPEAVYAQIRLDLPVPIRTGAKPPAPTVAPPEPEALVRTETRETPAPPPVDIPGFVVVSARVASGQQPFPDGIAWLQSKGYHTVLHLRAPGEDGTAARRQFEKRGLQYVSLEVAPGVLTKDLADQFDRIVADETNLPLFVCDKDGALTGSLWYLHFRLKGLPDEKALAEATRFGFRPEQDADHKALLNTARTLLTAP